jgi:hypothetical protein
MKLTPPAKNVVKAWKKTKTNRILAKFGFRVKTLIDFFSNFDSENFFSNILLIGSKVRMESMRNPKP